MDTFGIMMPLLTDEEYRLLDLYVRRVLERAGVPDEKMSGAIEDLMHPLTALNDDNPQEFLPYMRTMLNKWRSTPERK